MHHGSFMVSLRGTLERGRVKKGGDVPILDAIAKGLEADASIVRIVLDDFLLVQPATVAVMQALGEIPMVDSLTTQYVSEEMVICKGVPYDKGGDTVGQ